MLFRSTKVFLLNFLVPALGIYSQDPGLVSGASDRASRGKIKNLHLPSLGFTNTQQGQASKVIVASARGTVTEVGEKE